MIRKIQRRVTVTETVQWTGENVDEIVAFTAGEFRLAQTQDDPECTGEVLDRLHSTWIGVKVGQWVTRGQVGEFYPIEHVQMVGNGGGTARLYDFVDGLDDTADTAH